MPFPPELVNGHGFTVEHCDQIFTNDAQKLRVIQQIAAKVSEIFQNTCINAEIIHDGED